jgi:cephalosporin-C deacetylase-like acetyl esterase
MKPICHVIAALLLATIVNADTPTPTEGLDDLYFHGQTDHANAVYASGENMVFSFSLKDAKGELVKNQWVKWTRNGDDHQRTSGMVNTKDQNPVVVKTSLATPGFVRVSVMVCDESGGRMKGVKHWAPGFDCSAGVEFEQLREGVPEPTDFDAFWDRQKTELAKVPLEVLEKKFVGEQRGKLIYDVKVACLGKRPVSGYLVLPKDAKAKSLPATVSFRGYGVTGAYKPLGCKGIGFEINAHGIENGREQAYYTDLKQGDLYRYGFDNDENENRDTSYFKGMLIRVIRALQYVKSLPEWDGKTLEVKGGSQGGFQSLAAAGLDPDVSYCFAELPWLCDLGGVKTSRMSGWRPSYRDALLYFDSANHAKRITCDVSILAGLGDYVCPPSGIAVLYNNITFPVTLKFQQGRAHSFRPKEKGEEPVFSKNTPEGK